MSDMRLYKATSVIDGWPHRGVRYDGIQVQWIPRDGGRFRDRIAELIHPPTGDPEPDHLVDDYLTLEEAEALREYLKDRADVVIEEVDLPIPTTAPDGALYISLASTPLGGPRDMYMLWEEDGYDLALEVGGMYDLEAR